jgi:hypothetical protein
LRHGKTIFYELIKNPVFENCVSKSLNLREQIKNVCQLGAHGNKIFTRSQAKAILGITLSLLAEPTVGFARIESASEVHPS